MNKKHQSELEDLMSENEKLSIKINEYEENLGRMFKNAFQYMSIFVCFVFSLIDLP